MNIKTANHRIMIEVKIKDATLSQAATEGMDAFLKVFTDSISHAIGDKLTADNMAELNADQITLLAWSYLHEEVMDGGFLQLIYNGYGAFIFRNPFGVAMREWGLPELYHLIKKGRKLYDKYHEEIERERSDEDFMAMFEQYPEFDELDDEFIEFEEEWTDAVAHYVDEHISQFATIVND